MRRKAYLLCRRCEREYPRSGFELRRDGGINVSRCRACKAEIESARDHQMRTCLRCKQDLPVAAFDFVYKSGNIPNGHQERCRACRAQIRAERLMPVAQRFWAKTKRDPETGCRIWQAGFFTDGYGAFQMGGKVRRAHTVAWELTNGPVPKGMKVCHYCPGGDNPACSEPSHLWLGTSGDNMKDMVAKGRACRTSGSDRWSSKLTEAIVSDIRDRYAAGGETYESLATEYGVTFQNVWHIVQRKTWQHVSD